MKLYFFHLIFIFLTHIANSIEIEGSWSELETKLKAGDLSKLPVATQKFGKNYYCVVIQQTDWKKAKLWCEERGGHLATITSLEEKDFCQILGNKTITHNYHQLFLGASDHEKEGEWIWVTGEKFDYTWWGNKNPDNFESTEHYLSMRPELDGKWNDVPLSHDALKGFIIEWEGTELNKQIQVLADAGVDFPKAFLPIHKMIQQKLTSAKKSADDKTFKTLVKAYGKKIVAKEKLLTQQRKIKEAKAVRKVKLELIALLTPSKDKVQDLIVKSKETKPDTHVLINKGQTMNGIDINRNGWKKKAGSLSNTTKHATIELLDKIVDKGDFSLTARIKLDRIGGTWPMMKIGETEAGIDGSESKAWMQFGALFRNEHKGERTAGIVPPDTYFDWKLERKDNKLTVSVDDTILLNRNIHTEPLGAISLRSGAATMTIKSLIFEGRLKNPIKSKSVVASHERPEQHYGTGQVVHLRKKNLICLYRGHHNNGTRRIRIHHSKDNGETWQDQKIVVGTTKNEGEISSFSSVFNTQKNACHLIFTRGDSNQNIYTATGKNYARMWSDPAEITFSAKQQGWDVIFTNTGLTTKYGKKRDQILVPYHAGAKVKDLYLLHSDNGKDWNRIGPIMKGTSGIASIVEFNDGKLLIASGGQHNLRTSVSTDGGFTWGEEVNSSLSINQHRGSMAVVSTAEEREILLYSGSTNPRGDQTNNLNLWASKDSGKTWLNIGMVCYGPSYYSNLIAQSPGEVGLFVRAYSHWNRAQQRYHKIKLQSLGLP